MAFQANKICIYVNKVVNLVAQPEKPAKAQH